MIVPKKEFMDAAILQAIQSKDAGDYAVGASIVKDNQLIVAAGNRVRLDQNPFHHAEICAIQSATKIFNDRHLNDCVLYTTHEPCPMCTSAAIWARMKGIVYGAKIDDMIDYRKGNGNSDWSWMTIDIPSIEIAKKATHQLEIIPEFMREECKKLFHSK